MEDNFLEEIKQEIQSWDTKGKTSQRPIDPLAHDHSEKDVYLSKREIPFSAVYTKLNSGNYVAKYDNYKTAYGNENRLALEQSSTEQWANGIWKAGRKTLNYAIEGTVGLAYGLAQAVEDGSWSSLYNNDMSKTIDDWNTKLDNNFSNYYSDSQKQMSVFESMGTANFWADKFAGGLAFVGGTMLSEAAIGLVTGGGSLATLGARVGLRSGLKKTSKTALKRGLATADDIVKPLSANLIKKYDDVLIKQVRDRIRTGSRIGGALDIAGFAARSSFFEAGVEARGAIKEATDSYIQNYTHANGKPPTPEEMQVFLKDATNKGNSVFAANMVILAPSNLVMFGKMAGIGKKLSKTANNVSSKITGNVTNSARLGDKIVGRGIKLNKGKGGKLTASLNDSNRLQRNIGRAHKLLGKASVEGLYEEGFQGVANKTMADYLEQKYNGTSNEAINAWNSVGRAFHEQYTSKEGWEEMVIGMLIGGIGGPAIQQRPGESLKNIKSTFQTTFSKDAYQKQDSEIVERYNKSHKQTMTDMSRNMFRKMNSSKALDHSINSLIESVEGISPVDGQFKTINNNVGVQHEKTTAWNYINNMSGILSDSEMVDNFNTMVDGLEDATDSYKEDLKQNFSEQLDSAQKSKEAINALKIVDRAGLTPGNARIVEDALAYNMYMGQESGSIAQTIGNQIGDLLGSESAFNPLLHYANLEDTQSQELEEVRKLEAEVEIQTKLSVRLNSERQNRSKNKDSEADNAKENKLNEDITRITQEIFEKRDRIEKLKATLSSRAKSKSFNLLNKKGAEESGLFIDIDSILEKVKEIDTFLADLREEGKHNEANVLEELLTEFKQHTMNMEGVSRMFTDMSDPNYFKKDGKGKGKNLLARLVGKKYTMDKDTYSQLNENADKLVKAFAVGGEVLDGSKAVEVLKERLENDDKLSDKEKIKLESILRVRLLSQTILENTPVETIKESPTKETKNRDEIPKGNKTSDIPKETKKDDETTDDVNEEVEQESNVEKLDKLINNIIAQMHSLFKLNLSSDAFITKKEINRLEELMERDVKYEIDILNELTDEFEELADEVTEGLMKPLTDSEIQELKKLRDKFDNWVTLSGTVKGGIRLSDLLLRKFTYEELEKQIKDTLNLTENDSLTIEDFTMKTGDSYYNIIQSYFAGTLAADTKGENLTIQNITHKGFITAMGPNVTIVEENSDRSVTIQIEDQQIELGINEQGNIIIPKENIQTINDNTNIIIKPTNSELKSNYSILLQRTPEGIKPVQSDFSADYREGGMVERAINEAKKGDKITLKIDKTDKYNQELLEGVKISETTDTETTEDEGLDNMLTALEKAKAIVAEKTKQNQDIEDEVIDLDQVLDDEELESLMEKEVSDNSSKKAKTISDLEKSNKRSEESILIAEEERREGGINVDTKFLNSKVAKARKSIEKNNLKIKETKQEIREEIIDRLENVNDRTVEANILEITKRNKEITKLEKRIEKRKFKPKKPRKTKPNNGISEEKMAELKRSLSIKVFDKEGNFVGVLKGNRDRESDRSEDVRFQVMRDSIVEEYIETLLNTEEPVSIELPIKVLDTFAGHPNYNFTETSENTLDTEFKEVETRDHKSIVDVGFITPVAEGKNTVTTKNKTEDLDTTYIAKQLKGSKKVPFVVINHYGKKIAFPVQINNKDKQGFKTAIEEAFHSELDPIQKAIQIDYTLSQMGINPNEAGNSFEYYSEGNNNFSEENLQKLLGIVDNFDYLYSPNDWMEDFMDMETIHSQYKVNINMKKPFHSPKLILDYSGLSINTEVPAKKTTPKISKKTSNTIADRYISQNQEDIDNTKKDNTCN